MTLPAPTTRQGSEGMDALLSLPDAALIGLDFDGTLAPIVPDPDDARAHPGAVPALARLAPRLGRVADVTGRPAATAVSHGGFAGVPGLEGLDVLGHYGLERWEAATGRVLAPAVDPGVVAVRAVLPELLEQLRADGVTVEDKHRSLAVHTRRAPDPDGLLDRLRGPMAELAGAHGLVVEPGRRVLELRPPGVDKGGAVLALAGGGERAPSVVVFVGDDLGDLAAFDAVDQLRSQGVPGLLVASGSTEEGALAARADLVVEGPDGVVALLDDLATALGA